jgi:hypothetical protein
VVSGHSPAHYPRSSPTPLPGGLGSMEHEERPAQHHPSPHRGVEGSWRASVDKATHPQPCPPASPSGVVGRSSWRAGTQQLYSPPLRAPSRTVPTWASVARGENLTQQEAPATSTSPSEAIALYTAGYEEISLFCRFPDPSATTSFPTRPLLTRRRQRR